MSELKEAEIDEIDAMKQMGQLMEKMGEGARERTLNWLLSKYGMKSGGPPRNVHKLQTEIVTTTNDYSSFAELFDVANPNGERERALVAAYWTQVCMGAESFPSQALNDQLKDLGHRVSNITDALTRLKSDKPALILQLKKSGTSKQARKTYKLTQEGIRKVDAMISAGNISSQSE